MRQREEWGSQDHAEVNRNALCGGMEDGVEKHIIG